MTLIDGIPDGRIDFLDRGFAYGDGVFRTMRIQVGRVLHWDRHYAKLSEDCARLDIVCPLKALLADELQRVAEVHPQGVARIIVTRGAGGRGYGAPENPKPTRVVSGFDYANSAQSRVQTGVQIRWCRTRVTEQPALAGVKHLNRLDSVLARSEWTHRDIVEGLMLDRDGWVIEGTMTNVFVLEGNRLTTPILDVAGVAGMQRDRLMSKCVGERLDCLEGRISRDRLLGAEAVYLTNSVIGLWWVARLDDRVWSSHPMTARLVAQIDSHNDD